MQYQLANFLAGGCASRFAGDGDGEAVSAERPRQLIELRALAAAVEAFEGDEFSAHGHSGKS